jgi:hypothetical protein
MESKIAQEKYGHGKSPDEMVVPTGFETRYAIRSLKVLKLK